MLYKYGSVYIKILSWPYHCARKYLKLLFHLGKIELLVDKR